MINFNIKLKSGVFNKAFSLACVCSLVGGVSFFSADALARAYSCDYPDPLKATKANCETCNNRCWKDDGYCYYDPMGDGSECYDPCDEPPPYGGDGWYCDEYDGWVCWREMCVSGPDTGKCMYECSCDPATKPEGDAWECENGDWICYMVICQKGPDAGKCMYSCSCDPATEPEGNAWRCDGQGEWLCWGSECDSGPDAGKCMSSCSCDPATKPEGDAWECSSWGYWECWGNTLCSSGPDAGKCMWECSCDPAEKPDDGNAWECENEDWICYTGYCESGPDAGKCMYMCDCGPKPADLEGDAWQCNYDYGEWECWRPSCVSGPDVGKCMEECSCDDSHSADDNWVCEYGEWICSSGHECTSGLNAGKCADYCECDLFDIWDKEGEGWRCNIHTGEWYCPHDLENGDCY